MRLITLVIASQHLHCKIHHFGLFFSTDLYFFQKPLLASFLALSLSTQRLPITNVKLTSTSKAQNSIVLLRQGLSTREIAKRVHIFRSTVARIRAQSQENIPVSKGGRPSKVSNETKKMLRRKFDTGAFKHLQEGQRLVQEAEVVHVHTRTIRSYLDMKAYVKRERPLLSNNDKKAQYKFAKSHLHWTVEQWKQVIFTDETLARMVCSYGRQFYYKDPKRRTVRPHHIKGMAQGGGRVMPLCGYGWR